MENFDYKHQKKERIKDTYLNKKPKKIENPEDKKIKELNKIHNKDIFKTKKKVKSPKIKKRKKINFKNFFKKFIMQ